LASERGVSDIVCAPGNAGIARVARCIPVDAADPHALVAIAQREEIDFTIIGPELPLSRGVADVFADEGLLLLGPTQRAARLESSKVFAKEFMLRTGVPTTRSPSCNAVNFRFPWY
jgi:phosphoribosylamine--glycine ligase